MDKEKEKPEDKRTSLTGGKMQKVESKSTESRQKRDTEHGVGKYSHFGGCTQEPADTNTYSPLMSIQEPKIPTAFSRNQ